MTNVSITLGFMRLSFLYTLGIMLLSHHVIFNWARFYALLTLNLG